jgi:hypothetical protein
MLICPPKSFWPTAVAVFTLPDLRKLHALATTTGNAQQAFFVWNVGHLISYWLSVAYVELSSEKPIEKGIELERLRGDDTNSNLFFRSISASPEHQEKTAAR